MSLKKCLTAALGMIVLGGTAVLAQQPQQPTEQGTKRIERGLGLRGPGQRGMRGMRRGMKGEKRELGLSSSLNLTPEQTEAKRAIVQRHLAATKSQREQLFQLREKKLAGTFTEEDQARTKTLRQELRESMMGIRNESLALLTAEQRTRLESLRAERQQRREEMMKRRRDVR
jgi:Spy/CpxP family protein refolding chaperone